MSKRNKINYKWLCKTLHNYISWQCPNVDIVDLTHLDGYDARAIICDYEVRFSRFLIVIGSATSWKHKLFIMAHELAHCMRWKNNRLIMREQGLADELQTDQEALQILQQLLDIENARHLFRAYWWPRLQRHRKGESL